MSPTHSCRFPWRAKRELLFCSLSISLLIMVWQIGVIRRNMNKKVALLSVDVNNLIDTSAKESFSPKDILTMDQTDKKLHEYIKRHHIFPPSTLKYDFGKSDPTKYLDGSVGVVVYPLFKNKTGGFFVEVGANDGIISHTLALERYLHWNGLLIECHPELIPILKSVHRKAYISDACLSDQNHPTMAKLKSMNKWLDSSSFRKDAAFPTHIKSNYTTYDVQTLPLFSILASIEISQVDLIVLDIQGLEFEVLKHFPFDSLLVKVWVVEVEMFSPVERDSLIKFMDGKGYPRKRVVVLTYDFVFIHQSVV